MGDDVATGYPLVTFVIPVFNDEKNIACCLESIRNQEFLKEAFDIIVLDNGSTDGTHEILKNLGISFQIIPRVHVSTLRNIGASSAKGNFLGFVDSDVEISPHWLTNALKVFEDKEIVACGCFPEVPPKATWVQQTWDLHQRGRHYNQKPVPVSWLPSMNFMVRRETFKSIGGFNEKLETAEDVDLCYRLGKHGTILSHTGMQAVHWGEAKDLATFWKKEVWRGMGNYAGVFSHGFRWDEAPSLLYPLYVLCFVLLSSFAGINDIMNGKIFLMPLALGFLSLPALVLAVNTTMVSKRINFFVLLFVLYLIYGLARAVSLVKASWFSRK